MDLPPAPLARSESGKQAEFDEIQSPSRFTINVNTISTERRHHPCHLEGPGISGLMITLQSVCRSDIPLSNTLLDGGHGGQHGGAVRRVELR